LAHRFCQQRRNPKQAGRRLRTEEREKYTKRSVSRLSASNALDDHFGALWPAKSAPWYGPTAAGPGTAVGIGSRFFKAVGGGTLGASLRLEGTAGSRFVLAH